MKKFFVSLFILTVFAGVVFTIGWTALFLPRGSVGILSSKTSGIDPTPVMPGEFCWHWERLIPTNAEILSFNLAPVSRSATVSGKLPSGDTYASMIGGNHDFSWKATYDVTVRVSASRLPNLVRDLGVKNQSALDTWTNDNLTRLVETAVTSVVTAAITSASPSTLELGANPTIERDISARLASQQKDFEIVSVTITMTAVPDIALYTATAAAWKEYNDQRTARLFSAATVEAEAAFSEYLQFERFTRLGEVLTKYPVLIDYLAVMKSEETAALKSLRSYR